MEHASLDDIKWLQTKVRTIIDLRDKSERQKERNRALAGASSGPAVDAHVSAAVKAPSLSQFLHHPLATFIQVYQDASLPPHVTAAGDIGPPALHNRPGPVDADEDDDEGHDHVIQQDEQDMDSPADCAADQRKALLIRQSLHSDGVARLQSDRASGSRAPPRPQRVVFSISLARSSSLYRWIWGRTPWTERLRFIALQACCCRRRAVDVLVAVFARQGLLGLNQFMIQHAGKEISHVLKVMASPEHLPVVFHCMHGKDRTGLIAALVLHVLGVPRALIVQDYACTAALLPDSAFAHFAKLPGFLNGDWRQSPAAVMEATLAFMEQRHGSVDRYLNTIGFTEVWRERLRDLLLEDIPSPPVSSTRSSASRHQTASADCADDVAAPAGVTTLRAGARARTRGRR